LGLEIRDEDAGEVLAQETDNFPVQVIPQIFDAPQYPQSTLPQMVPSVPVGPGFSVIHYTLLQLRWFGIPVVHRSQGVTQRLILAKVMDAKSGVRLIERVICNVVLTAVDIHHWYIRFYTRGRR
jgi:hypothetical protein